MFAAERGGCCFRAASISRIAASTSAVVSNLLLRWISSSSCAGSPSASPSASPRFAAARSGSPRSSAL